MKNSPILSCIFLSVIFYPMALKAAELKFDTVPVRAKHADFFSGTMPRLQGAGFNALNRMIQKDLYAQFDQDVARIVLDSRKIYQDQQYLSFEVFREVSGGTMSYKAMYYSIDLKQKKLLHLQPYLDQHQLSSQHIQQALADYVTPCLSDAPPDYCEDMALQSLLHSATLDPDFFNINNSNSFYLKKGILGLNFASTKYTYAFEYDLKSQRIL